MKDKFTSNSTVTYDIGDNGITTVTHDITLQNKTSGFYATSYTLSINGITPIKISAQQEGVDLPTKIKQDKNTTSIEVDFPNEVVGIGSKREFFITFQDKSLVKKNGEIWEITTPKLADTNSFDFFSTIIRVPASFGNLAYMSPGPSFKEKQNLKTVYSFDKSASLETGISAAFGNFQVFSFNLTYHLENPLNENATTDIALPPDTSYQKLNYTKITPQPKKIAIDKDGNWIATIPLKPHEKIDLQAKGAVQIFPTPQEFPKTNYENVTNNLASTQLWQTDSAKIKTLAKNLKTPKAIYDYVITHLSYDYSKVTQDVERLGALKALENPKSAICTEFTDLFIALARAAGIPAREVEGFAYTDNPKIQPLSLVADVLHAWPQYWDDAKQSWIAIDPTWGETSGTDYFNKLDLKHFTFVIHGQDSRKPYPAGSYKSNTNPQKDVEVSFGQLPQDRSAKLQVQNTVLSQLPFSNEIINTKITNSGPTAVYNQNLQFNFDNNLTSSTNIDIIPPFGFFETKIEIPYSFLGQQTPAKVQVLISGTKKTEFTTYKNFVTVSNLLMLCLFVFFAVAVVYLKFKDAKKRNLSQNKNT